MTQFKRTRILVVLALLFSFTFVTTTTSGCYGKFAVTKKLYDWNGSLGNKFLKTVVFWAFIIIPAYELVMLGDFLIFNLIEFWSGNNPIGGGSAEAPKTRMIAKDTIELRRAGRVYHLRAVNKDSFELAVDGRIVARGQRATDGGMIMTNLDKKTVGYIDPQTIQAVQKKMSALTKAPSAG